MSHFRRFPGLILVVMAVLRCETENGNPMESPEIPEIPVGTIHGVVTSGDSGSPMSGAEVWLNALGISRSTTSGQDGVFMFADVSPGVHSVSAIAAGTACNSAEVDLQAGQSAAVAIACDPLGSIVGTVSVDGLPIGTGTVNGAPDEHATVDVSGPVGYRSTSTGHQGHFGFENLLPGTYTLQAHNLTRLFLTPTTVFPLICESITVTVQASQTVEANVSCTIPEGGIGGTVTINGEARPIVWVELQFASSGFPWAYGTTNPNGSWAWDVPAAAYVVSIKTPPGLTCDAKRKSATVEHDQQTVVNFACVGDVKDSIQGFTSNEFGTYADASVTLRGPVKRATLSNEDGFYAFEDLPPGDYVLDLCQNPQSVAVRDGAVAFVDLDCS